MQFVHGAMPGGIVSLRVADDYAGSAGSWNSGAEPDSRT